MLTSFFRHYNLYTIHTCLAATAFILLSVAYVAEYFFGFKPCELCLLQRYPYMMVIVFWIISALLPQTHRMQWWLLTLSAAALMIDAAIALYHTGVEWRIFTGPAACTEQYAAGRTLHEIRESLMGKQAVSCDEPALVFLGLSMAAWNALAAAALSVFSIIQLYARKKHESSAG